MLKKDLYNLRYAIIPLIIYCIIMQITFSTVCPFLALTKIPCPACGLTHASIYLVTGNIEKSLAANPTAILWITTIILFIIDRYIKPLKIKPFPYIFIIVSIITIIIYSLNMIRLISQGFLN